MLARGQVNMANEARLCSPIHSTFWFLVSSWSTHLSFFYLSNLLQMPNDGRMIDVDFFGNFLCSCKRDHLPWSSLLVAVNFRWPATMFLIFKALFSFAKLLESPLHCMFISSSWAKCFVDVASSLQLYNPFWIQILKLLKFAFCLTSFL